MLLALCLLACTSNDPTRAWQLAAPSEQQSVAQGAVTNLPGCATVTLTVSGSDKVAAQFPADSACRSGLVLISGGLATYDRPHGGRLALPIRVVNRSGAGVLSPVRVVLTSDSVAVLAAPGLSLNGKKGVTPLSADSATMDGAVWLVGTSGVVGGADSTAERQLTLAWADGVQQVKLAFAFNATPADTARPPLVDSIPLLPDSAHLVSNPNDTVRVYLRRYLGIRFSDTTSGIGVRSVLASIGAIVIGGSTFLDEYLVQVPDLGPDYAAFATRIHQLERDPRVDYVVPYLARDAKPVLHGRFPNDGPGHNRADWFSATTSHNWAMRAVRADLAWGCETGAYDGSAEVPIGILEWAADADHRELASANPTAYLAKPQSFGTPLPIDELDLLAWHGTAVAGVIGATAGDGYSVAGMMWKPQLHIYKIGLSQSQVSGAAGSIANGAKAVALDLIPQIARDHIRVLSISSDVERDTAFSGAQLQMNRAVSNLLTQDPQLLIVKATGDDGLTVSPSDLSSYQKGGLVILSALAQARLDPSHSFGDRIMFVGGTEDPAGNAAGNEWWGDAGGGSTLIAGMTDIAAPAAWIDLLGRSDPEGPRGAEIETASGTSFAAPMVAGAAGLLASFNPTLTPAEIRHLLIDGAALPKIIPGAGPAPVAPSPVHDVPDGEAIYQLDAYGALRLAAQRSGAPLCGNRMWLDSTGLEVERGGGMETIDPTSQEIEMAWLGPYHGGRKISLASEAQGYELLTLNAGGTWDHHPDPNYGTPGDSGFSGTLNSLYHLTHDADSAVVVTSDKVHFALTLLSYGDIYSTNPSGRAVATVTPSLIQPGGFVCSVQNVDSSGTATCLQSVNPTNDYETTDVYATPSPLGDSIYLVMNVYLHHFISLSGWASCAGDTIVTVGCMHQSSTYSAQSERADVWALPWNGGSPRVSWSLPGQEITWMGEAEDGSEFVFAGGHRTAAGFPSGTVQGCMIHFVDHGGHDRRPAITSYLDDCNPTRGTGGIAPTAGIQMAGSPEPYSGGLLMTRAMRGIKTR